MFKHTISDRPRDLYSSFRDGLFYDAIHSGVTEIEAWKLMPGVHTGRLNTVTLVRKMLDHMRKEFPGGIKSSAGKFIIENDLIEFIKTHWEMGSTDEEAKQAWQAMQSISGDR